MTFSPSIAKRLDSFLGSMPFEALNRLIREIERAKLRGDLDTVGRLIIERSRLLARKRKLRLARVPTPMRMFMVPLEPFLIDEPVGRKQVGRIARTSLTPIWTWLGRDLLKDRLAELEARAANAILAGQMDVALTHVGELQSETVAALEVVLGEADIDERARGRAAVRAGGEQELGDARDMLAVLKQADNLKGFGRSLPNTIPDLGEEEFDWLLGTVRDIAGRNETLIALALAILMARLRHPAQILHLAVYAAGSDEVEQVAAHPYGQAGQLVLHDIASAARDARVALGEPSGYQAAQIALARYYKLAHDMRVILEMTANDPWSKRLSQIRAELSSAIDDRIRAVPRLIRSTLAPRNNEEAFALPDPLEIEEAELAINLLQDSRVYMSELALNDIVAQLGQQIGQFLAHASDALVSRLRNAQPHERDNARMLLDAAVRLTRAGQGDEIATLLEHSGNRALQAADNPRRLRAV